MTEDQQRGAVDRAIGVVDRVATTLPAQFLALVILNLFFIFGLLWFLRAHEEDRIMAWKEILVSCTERSLPMKGQ